MISIGIDTLKGSLAVCAVDGLGRQVGELSPGNSPQGFRRLERFPAGMPSPRRVGIEGAGGLGAAPAHALRVAGEEVVEVPARLTARERRRLRRRGDRGSRRADCGVGGSCGTRLTEICGIGSLTAARLLAECGDARRFRSAAAFAMAAGAAPLTASSGEVQRHRLNHGGNGQLNLAPYTIAFVPSRCDPRAQGYLERSRAEGKSWKEAVRCLKRQLANVVCRQLVADLDEGRLTTQELSARDLTRSGLERLADPPRPGERLPCPEQPTRAFAWRNH